jgi:NAD(P)H-hydrate epimerase
MTNRVPILPGRSATSNKGDFGRALLVGGSFGMSGAISIAAMGTLRSGAGLTTVATAETCLSMVTASHPALMTIPLAADRRGRIDRAALARIKRQAASATAVAIGPGMGQSSGLQKLVRELYQTLPIPLVVDADALNLLSRHADWSQWKPPAARILTPHPGEFARLSGVSAKEREAQINSALEYSKNDLLTIVLKGHETVVCRAGEGFKNQTGNPKMAVGGSGDLLTGIILALVCQRMSPLDASRLGCHVHGLAGDFAAAKLGAPSVLATDILEELATAFSRLT